MQRTPFALAAALSDALSRRYSTMVARGERRPLERVLRQRRSKEYTEFVEILFEAPRPLFRRFYLSAEYANKICEAARRAQLFIETPHLSRRVPPMQSRYSARCRRRGEALRLLEMAAPREATPAIGQVLALERRRAVLVEGITPFIPVLGELPPIQGTEPESLIRILESDFSEFCRYRIDEAESQSGFETTDNASIQLSRIARGEQFAISSPKRPFTSHFEGERSLGEREANCQTFLKSGFPSSEVKGLLYNAMPEYRVSEFSARKTTNSGEESTAFPVERGRASQPRSPSSRSAAGQSATANEKGFRSQNEASEQRRKRQLERLTYLEKAREMIKKYAPLTDARRLAVGSAVFDSPKTKPETNLLKAIKAVGSVRNVDALQSAKRKLAAHCSNEKRLATGARSGDARPRNAADALKAAPRSAYGEAAALLPKGRATLLKNFFEAKR